MINKKKSLMFLLSGILTVAVVILGTGGFGQGSLNKSSFDFDQAKSKKYIEKSSTKDAGGVAELRLTVQGDTYHVGDRVFVKFNKNFDSDELIMNLYSVGSSTPIETVYSCLNSCPDIKEVSIDSSSLVTGNYFFKIAGRTDSREILSAVDSFEILDSTSIDEGEDPYPDRVSFDGVSFRLINVDHPGAANSHKSIQFVGDRLHLAATVHLMEVYEKEDGTLVAGLEVNDETRDDARVDVVIGETFVLEADDGSFEYELGVEYIDDYGLVDLSFR